MAAIEPSVGTPRQSIYQVVDRFGRETVEFDHRLCIRHVISIFIGDEDQVRRRTKPDTSEARRDATQTMTIIEEDLAVIEFSVAVLIAQNNDPVLVLALKIRIRK